MYDTVEDVFRQENLWGIIAGVNEENNNSLFEGYSSD